VQPSSQDLDVDARFILANERTVLAWIRTALALLAGGAAVFQFGDELPGDLALSALLVLLGAAAALLGALRYVAADRSIRAGELPPRGRSPVVLAAAVVLLAGALLAAELVASLS
jgi:putative membrane protein